ncbi:hypothetical protein NHX12_012312, partial [Muraenolepis orangiensis]
IPTVFLFDSVGLLLDWVNVSHDLSVGLFCPASGPWTVNELLITGASIATIALAGCVTAVVVCCRRKKSKNKVVESQPDSSKPKAPLDAGSVIYSAVEYKPHPPPPVQLYDNFRDPVAGWTENVEYGTLALSQ